MVPTQKKEVLFMTTITKAMKFTAVADFLANSDAEFQIADTAVSASDMADFLRHESEMASKRNSSKGMTKIQKENEPIKESILAILEDADTGMTVKELIATDELCNYTPQKISALLTLLRKEKKVRRDYQKKIAYFSLGTEED